MRRFFSEFHTKLDGSKVEFKKNNSQKFLQIEDLILVIKVATSWVKKMTILA